MAPEIQGSGAQVLLPSDEAAQEMSGKAGAGLPGVAAPEGPWYPQGSTQHHHPPVSILLPPLFPSVKLRDFESAVNNFEKALERAKLVHNNEAQQAIINVSLSLWGWGGAGPGPSAPAVYFPSTSEQLLGGAVALQCLLLPSVYIAPQPIHILLTLVFWPHCTET